MATMNLFLDQPPRNITKEMKSFAKTFPKPIKLKVLGSLGNIYTLIMIILFYGLLFGIFSLVGLYLSFDIMIFDSFPIPIMFLLFIINQILKRKYLKKIKTVMINGTVKDMTIQASSLNYNFLINNVPQHVFDVLLDEQEVKIGTHDSRIINTFSKSKFVPVLYYDKNPDIIVPIELILPNNTPTLKQKIKKINM